jgi:acetoin utilization protein AcuC
MDPGFCYSEEYEKYNFGEGHPLTPKRIEVTFALMKEYELVNENELTLLTPRLATEEEVLWIHKPAYIEKLKELNQISQPSYQSLPEFGLGPGDNPIFPGMYDAAMAVCGASLTAAEYLLSDENHKRSFNIMGGLHHAIPEMASGFCILNDVAIAIEKLIRNKPGSKVLYIDYDAHHGDGVQSIFYERSDVLTLSFHQDGHTLFPGTGFLNENGKGEGKGYALNVPLLPGTIDTIFLDVFGKLVPQIMDAYRPDKIVIQNGVDMHFLDPLTNMGLSTEGLEKLYKGIDSWSPKYTHDDKILALGGGGYNIGVVARVWSMLLANMMHKDIDDPLPAAWLESLEEKWEHFPTPLPVRLRDRNWMIEEKQLKDPYWEDSLWAHVDNISTHFENTLIPQIKP